jgi:hypothetical protein
MGASEIPSATAVPINDAEMVQVIAPATLNAGYSFQAIYNGSTFTVVVVSAECDCDSVGVC